MVKLARMVGFITWEIQIPSRRVEPFRDTRGPGELAVAKRFETLGKSGSPKARRDQAILRLLFDLGLRRESIVFLDLQHWSGESKTPQVMLKGHSQRMPKGLPPMTPMRLSDGWRFGRCAPDFTPFCRFFRDNPQLRR
jgi:integrase/recombinase XerC